MRNRFSLGFFEFQHARIFFSTIIRVNFPLISFCEKRGCGAAPFGSEVSARAFVLFRTFVAFLFLLLLLSVSVCVYVCVHIYITSSRSLFFFLFLFVFFFFSVNQVSGCEQNFTTHIFALRSAVHQTTPSTGSFLPLSRE